MHDIEAITRLLADSSAGDLNARDQLIELLYDQLHALAHQQIQRGARMPTLSTTVLVNEAFMRLFRGDSRLFENRAHFFSCAALAMRQLLIDYARRRQAGKRSPEVPMPTFEPQAVDHRHADIDELLVLDEALNDLDQLDQGLSQLVELRFFAGLSVEDIAQLRDCSTRTVVRDWRKARAYLSTRIVT